VREHAKAMLRRGAGVAALPAVISFRVRALVIGRDAALEGSTQTLGLIPGLAGQYLRRAFLSHVLPACGARAVIGFRTVFSQAGTRIGENAYIGPDCHIGLADIGKNAMIASGVHIPSGRYTHGIGEASLPPRLQDGTPVRVHIGEGAWIGSNAVVLADVGAGTIVGAGAVVTRPLPAGVVAAGVPARVLRHR
jgi:virginiamycin A acetyltransferase